MSNDGYAGDVSPQQAYALLQTDAEAVLVDVRTLPEWQYVGLPDLSALDKRPVLLSWQDYPTMAVRSDFPEALAAAGVPKQAPVLLICRSGIRSQAAAQALTAAGYTKAFNVSEGFEGPLDGAQHRGQAGGWKAAGLPWLQK